MTGRKVLVDAGRRARPAVQPAPDFGWELLGWLGLVFLLVGWLDLALTWVPPHFGNPEWEFGTVSAMLDGMPVATLGMGLLVGTGVACGRRWLVKTMAVVLVVVAIVIVLSAALYVTNVPFALNTTMEPFVRTGLMKAMVKTAGQAILYPAAFGWIAVKAWRHARGQT